MTIMQILSLISTLFPTVESIIEKIVAAINSTPGTAEHTAATTTNVIPPTS